MNRSCLALLLLAAVSTESRAEPLPVAVVLRPTAPAKALSFRDSLLSVLRARLDDLSIVRTAGTPALGLRDLQLAVGCLSEAPECLKRVAGELEVDLLIIPTINETGGDLVLELAAFDARRGSDSRRAVQLASGADRETTLLQGVEKMLKALFLLPERVPVAGSSTTTAQVVYAPPAPPPEPHFLLTPAPWLVTSGVALTAGIIAGALAQSAKRDYANSRHDSVAEVDAALERLDSAQGRATAANVLYVVSAVAGAAGVSLLAIGGEP